ncbi:MAG: ABC transporter ATP-binding protein [Pseudomonadota bacterium]
MAIESDKQPIIALDGVAKAYALFDSKMQRVRHALLRTNHEGLAFHHALHDVNLTVYEGEMVGILGLNGAGKSTLLQIMTGVLQPSSGQVRVNGTIAALLELGAGFNPEWTGRENARFQLQLGGAANDELEGLIEDVIDFADIGVYFDQPVRTYSSGMFVRLAFATSIVRRPDLLIIDEALAVGDARFQNKCYNRINELKALGTTIVLVSHSMEVVLRFCDRAAVLEGGRITFDGAAKEATEYYLKLLYGGAEEEEEAAPIENAPAEPDEKEVDERDVWEILEDYGKAGPAYYNAKAAKAGSGMARIGKVALLVDGTFEPDGKVNSGDLVELFIKVEAKETLNAPSTGLIVKTVDGVQLDLSAGHMHGIMLPPLEAGETAVFKMSFRARLAAGDYFLDLGVAETALGKHRADDWRVGLIQLTVLSNLKNLGPADLEIRALAED